VLPLYVDDYRYGKEPLRTKVEVQVPVADGVGGRPGTAWCVAARDVLRQLQQTPGFIAGQGISSLPFTAGSFTLSNITGRVKVGTPDIEDPDYTCYFVQAAVGDLANAPASPDVLTVPAGPKQKLVLRVHNVRLGFK
jgi:hypothetical protein